MPTIDFSLSKAWHEDDEQKRKAAQPTPNPPPKAAQPEPVNVDVAYQGDPLHNAYREVQGTKPDSVAEINKLSRWMQTDPGIVADDLDTARHVAAAPDFVTLRQKAPVLAKAAENPNFMAVARDDMDNLARIEQTMAQRRQDSLAALQEFVPAFRDTKVGRFVNKYLAPIPLIGSAWGALETAYDYYRDTETMREFASGQATDRAGLLWDKRRNLIRQGKDLTAAELKDLELVERVMAFDTNKKGLGSFLPAAGELVGQQFESFISNEKNPYVKGAVAGTAVGLFTAGATGGVGAPAAPFTAGSAFSAAMAAGVLERSMAIEGGLAFKEFRELTHADGTPVTDQEALLASDIVGTINGALELVGFEAMLKVVPGLNKVAKQGVRGVIRNVPTVRQAVLGFLKNYATAWTGEVTTEMMQEFSNIVASNSLTDSAASELFGEETRHQLWEIFQKVGKGMAVVGVGGTVNMAANIDVAILAQRQEKALREATQNAEQFVQTMRNDTSLLRDRENETFREFAQRVAETHDTPQVHINAEALATVVAEQTGDLPTWLEQNGLSAQELGAAIAEGGDISIDTGVIMASPDPVFDALGPQMRLSLEDSSTAQVDRDVAGNSAHLVTMQSIYDREQSDATALQTYVAERTAEMAATGTMTELQAQVAILPMANMIQRMAQEINMPVAEFIDRHIQGRVFGADALISDGLQTLPQAAGDLSILEGLYQGLDIGQNEQGQFTATSDQGLALTLTESETDAGFVTPSLEVTDYQGGRGEGLRVYLTGLMKAQHQGKGWISSANPNAKVAGIYRRLTDLGVPFEKTEDGRFSIDAETLGDLDLVTSATVFLTHERRTFEQRAWHGSPHQHTGFSKDKIGTGEGAQAYGFGHYFASAKDVAEYYRKTLSGARFETANGTLDRFKIVDELIKQMERDGHVTNFHTMSTIANNIIDSVEEAGSSKKYFKDYDTDIQGKYRDFYASAHKALKSLGPDVKQTKGRLYEVELAPELDELLDWDKPLSEQSEKVRKALVGLNIDSNIKGDEIYRSISGVIGRLWKKETGNGIVPGVSGEKAASEYLHSLGIRGIKYLDGTSRNKGDGNHNFVIFDDADIEIISVREDTTITLDAPEAKPKRTRKKADPAVQSVTYLVPEGGAPIPSSVKASLYTIMDQVQTGTFRHGMDQVTSPEQAAHVLASLRRNGREQMMVLALDENKRPVGIVDVSQGTVNASLVNPRETLGAVMNIPGVKSVWLAHNHPSGVAAPSGADHTVTGQLVNAAKGSGLNIEGHVILGDNGSFVDIARPYDTQPVQPAARRQSVPVYGMPRFRKRGNTGAVSQPSTVASLMAGKPTGVVLLNTKNHIVGFVPMTTKEMMTLRTGDIDTGAGLLLRSAQASGAISMIPYVQTKATSVESMSNSLHDQVVRGALLNMEKFGKASDIRMLDLIVGNKDGDYRSASERGLSGMANGDTSFNQDEARGSVTFKEKGFDIKLLEQANLSTYLHETGHVFLETLRTMSLEYGAMGQEWQTIKDWLGIGEDNQITTEQHEQFARGAEAYFREGKAPTVELRTAFRTFKNWLLKIYQSLQGLNVTLTDEVRGVFDRMLATEADIRQAKQYEGLYSLLDKQAMDALQMTPEEQTAYLRLGGMSDAEAQEVVDKHKMLDLRERRRDYRDQAIRDWEQLPSTLTIKSLIDAGGINRTDLVLMYGEDILQDMPKNVGLFTNKGKPLAQALLDLDMTRDDLLDMLRGHQTKTAYVAAEVARMEGEYDASIDPADAVHNDKLRDQMEMESRLLAQAARQQSIAEARVLREYADTRVKGMTPKEIRDTNRTIVALRKARLAANAAVRQGDYTTALAENEKARVSEAVLAAKIRAKEALTQQQARFKRNLKNVTRNPEKFADGFRDQLLRLAMRFTLVETRIPAFDPHTDLLGFFEAINQKAAGDDLAALVNPAFGTYPWLYDETIHGKWQELTYQQIQELSDLFKFLYKQGRIDQAALLSDGRSRDEVVAALTEVIHKTGIEAKGLKEFAPFKKLRKLMSRMGAEQIPLQYILGRIDGFDTSLQGRNAKEIFNRLSDAAAAEHLILKDLYIRLRPVIDGLQASAQRHPRILTNLPVPVIWRLPGQDQSVWTFDKVVAFALNLGNADNMSKLLDGFEFGIDEAKQVVSILTSEDWAHIQEIWNIVDSLWPQMAEVHRKVKHFVPPKVPATPFQIVAADGKTVDVQGGYYPLMFDRRDERVDQAADRQDILASHEAMYPSVKTPQGFTIERQKTAGQRPVELSLSVLTRHLNSVAHHVTHAEALIDIDMITRSPDYKEAVTRALGIDLMQQIRPALARIANPHADGAMLAVDKVLEGERGKAAAFILFYNVQVGLKQGFSLANLAQAMHKGKKQGGGSATYHLMKAYATLVRNPAETLRTVHALSPNMERRAKGIDRELQRPENLGRVRKLTGKESVEQRLDKISEASGPALIRFFDFVAAYPGWMAAYQQGLRLNAGDQTAAVQYADGLTAATQPFDRTMDQSQIRASKRSMARFLTMFSGYTFKYANRRSFYWQGWQAGQISHSEFFFHVMVERIAPSLAMTAMLGMLANGIPEDEDEWMDLGKDALLDLLLFQFAGRYLIQDLAAGIFSLGRRGMLDSPVKTGAEILSKNARKIYDAIEDEEGLAGALAWAMAEILCYQTKLPVTRVIEKAQKGHENIEDGDGTIINYAIPSYKR